MEAEIAVRIESGSSEQARSVKLYSTQVAVKAGTVASTIEPEACGKGQDLADKTGLPLSPDVGNRTGLTQLG